MKLLYILKESLLSEVFDKPYAFRLSKMKSGDVSSGNLEGEVVYTFKDKDDQPYYVEFASYFSGGSWMTNVSYYTANDSLKMTNKYDIKVLSTVAAVVSDFTNKFQPEYLEYEGIKEDVETDDAGEEYKRARVYRSMIEKVKDKLPEYVASFEGSTGILKRTVDRVPPSDSKEMKYFDHLWVPSESE